MNPTLDAAARSTSEAELIRQGLEAHDAAWGTAGWTRRRFLAGVGMAGVAAIGSQLVTSRAAYAATASTSDRTVVVVFLRGAADGLRILVPNAPSLGSNYLQNVRPKLVPSTDHLIALPNSGGWALNDAMQPLFDGLWGTGELAFVPAVSAPGIQRSHFQAQQFLERGGVPTATTGWIERVLEGMGTGATFRAVSLGSAMPASLTGSTSDVSMSSLADFTMTAWPTLLNSTRSAVAGLYRGFGGTLGQDVQTTMGALDTAASIQSGRTNATYPKNPFADALSDIAAILHAEVGLQVATVDLGGWDTHADEANGDLDYLISGAAASLRAFMDDLGPDRRKRVTVVVMTEFGRRVMMNASGGTDHGHGSVMWLLGGGLAGSGVYGKWNELSGSTLDQGDVAGLNNPFDVLGELATKRLNAGSMTSVFPGHSVAPLGLATEL